MRSTPISARLTWTRQTCTSRLAFSYSRMGRPRTVCPTKEVLPCHRTFILRLISLLASTALLLLSGVLHSHSNLLRARLPQHLEAPQNGIALLLRSAIPACLPSS